MEECSPIAERSVEHPEQHGLLNGAGALGALEIRERDALHGVQIPVRASPNLLVLVESRAPTINFLRTLTRKLRPRPLGGFGGGSLIARVESVRKRCDGFRSERANEAHGGVRAQPELADDLELA